MKCAKCGSTASDNEESCPTCGVALHTDTNVKCYKCGSTASGNEKYCSTCGQELDTVDRGTAYETSSTESNYSDTVSSLDTKWKKEYQAIDEIKNELKPAIDFLSDKVTEHISLRNGMITGAVAYITGLLAVLLTFFSATLSFGEGENITRILGQDDSIMSIVMESGVIFYSAHNSVIGTTGDIEGVGPIPGNYIDVSTDFLADLVGDAAEINLALWTSATFFVKLFYLLIPAAIFISGYIAASRTRKEGEPSYLSVIRGGSLTAGYLPLAVIGSFVFTVEAPEVTWTPKLGSALLLVGLLYPISFGSLGGAVASLVPRLEYSLKSSIRSGFLGGVASIIGTLLLTFVTIDSPSADTVEMLQTGLILHAYSVNYAIPGNPTYELPTFLFGLIVVGSTVLAGSLASRRYRTSLRKSVASGMSISIGFSLVFLIVLYLMLFPFQIEPVIIIEDDLILRPVDMWVYGGVIYPALVGGATAGLEYYRR